MILILAGSYVAAQYRARYELNLEPREWEYISAVHKLYPWHGEGNFVAFGYGFWDRSDAGEMLDIVRNRGFKGVRERAEG